jgi:hypothetical protein
LQHGLEDVLVILQGDHKPIPDLPPPNQPVHLQPLPPAEGDAANPNTAPNISSNGGAQTDLDREVERTRRLGEDQKHVFGERGRGAPDFNKIPDNKVPDLSARPAAAPAAAPPVNQPRP